MAVANARDPATSLKPAIALAAVEAAAAQCRRGLFRGQGRRRWGSAPWTTPSAADRFEFGERTLDTVELDPYRTASRDQQMGGSHADLELGVAARRVSDWLSPVRA
jgi:hypothetical protein